MFVNISNSMRIRAFERATLSSGTKSSGIGLMVRNLSPHLLSIGAVVCLALAAPPVASAAAVTVAEYTFSGDSLASGTNPYATAANIVIGPGLSGDTAFDSNSGSTELGVYSGYLPTSEAAAVTGSDYISFTVTPRSGLINYNTLFFNIDVEAFENATAFTGSISVRSSVDGFTADLVTATGGPFTSGGNNEDSGASSGPLSLPTESGPVEFRFYFYDDQNDDSFNTISIDNIIVTAASVPEVATTLVAAKGDIIGKHGNSALSVAGPPAVDAMGDVAFHAIVTGSGKNSTNDSGIVLYSGSTVTTVAGVGDSSNPTGDVLTKVSDPVLSGSGALAFLGTLKTGTNGVTASDDSGVWVYESGSATLVARTSGSAPTGEGNFTVPVTFSSFKQIAVNNAGGTAFLASLKGTHVNTTGLFATDAAGNLQLLTAVGHSGTNAHNLAVSMSPFVVLPLVGGQSRTIDTVDGNGVLLGEFNPPLKSSIGLALSGTGGFSESIVVNTTGTTPKGGTFKSFDEPIVNANGSVAFLSVVDGYPVGPGANINTSMIWLVTDGTNAQKIARVGNNAPDISGSNTPAVFSKLSDPVLDNNDRIAFAGTLQTGGTSGVAAADDTGIWVAGVDTGNQIARKGDTAPDSTGAPGVGKFSSFLQLVLPDVGGPVFLATLSGVPVGDDEAVFALTKRGTLVRVVGKGDTNLPTRDSNQRTVKSIGIFQTAPDVVGQSRSFDASTGNLVYQATFTDGTWGVYLVTFQ